MSYPRHSPAAKSVWRPHLTGTLALLAACLLILTAQITGATMNQSKQPTDPVRPTAQEIRAVSNWAARAFTSPIGESKVAKEGGFFLADGIPFSFVYGGTPSSKLLPEWTRQDSARNLQDRSEQTLQWTDPKTGLRVTAVVTAYKDFPAAEWVLHFENTGTADTPILESIQAADMQVDTQTGVGVLHHLWGDDYGVVGQDTFLPVDIPLYKGRNARLAPEGGRPSSGPGFPFFNYEYYGKGVIVAIGWTGQWAATLEHLDPGPTRIRAGMEQTHLLLHPGEKIRSPRILVLNWSGDRMRAHNQFRRLMLAHYSPRPAGKLISLPFALQTFDRYRFNPEWATEAGQLKGIRVAHDLGCDSYWLDAAWYEGGFPYGAGNWWAAAKLFPNGLKPLSDACHKLGMRFILWFDPERVAKDTQIDREHPDWVLRQPDTWGLFDLGNPQARRWLTDLLSKRIEEYGVDIYRNDFNVSPLNYWQQKDTPDRQGISEIRHVEGLYEMWDELLAKHPGLAIDNCASGGRRIDIETCKRSVPLWRSDSGCWEAPPQWNQVQSLGLSLFIPLHSTGIQAADAYTFRSAAAAGAICELGYMDSGFSTEQARAAIAEAKEDARFWYGDLYPLTNCNIATDHLLAFQLHRADLDAGIVLAFRREDCPAHAVLAPLSGVHKDRKYRLEFLDDARKSTQTTVSGRELVEKGLLIQLDKKRSCLLVRYKPAEAGK